MAGFRGVRDAAPYDLLRITSAQLIKVRYDVNRTTEVYLRDTAVTFLNKLMKRVQKININLTVGIDAKMNFVQKPKSKLRDTALYSKSNLYSGDKNYE